MATVGTTSTTSTTGGRRRPKRRPPPPLKLRPAAPGEVFVLVLDRNPGAHTRPHKRSAGKEVRVPGLSVNDGNAHGKGQNWLVGYRLQAELEELVRKAVTAQDCPAFVNCRPWIQETYVFARGARRDWRNYTGKALIDALVTAGVIRDDNDKVVNILRPILAVDPQRPRVEIRLEAVPWVF